MEPRLFLSQAWGHLVRKPAEACAAPAAQTAPDGQPCRCSFLTWTLTWVLLILSPLYLCLGSYDFTMPHGSPCPVKHVVQWFKIKTWLQNALQQVKELILIRYFRRRRRRGSGERGKQIRAQCQWDLADCCGLAMIRVQTLSPWTLLDCSCVLLMVILFLFPLMVMLWGKALGLGERALTSGDRSLRMSAGGCGLSGRGSLISNK